MKKLAIIAVLIAALAIPAAASAHRARPQHARIQSVCQLGPVFPPGRDFTFCGPKVYGPLTVWVRDPQTGEVEPMTFGRWLHLSSGI